MPYYVALSRYRRLSRSGDAPITSLRMIVGSAAYLLQKMIGTSDYHYPKCTGPLRAYLTTRFPQVYLSALARLGKTALSIRGSKLTAEKLTIPGGS